MKERQSTVDSQSLGAEPPNSVIAEKKVSPQSQPSPPPSNNTKPIPPAANTTRRDHLRVRGPVDIVIKSFLRCCWLSLSSSLLLSLLPTSSPTPSRPLVRCSINKPHTSLSLLPVLGLKATLHSTNRSLSSFPHAEREGWRCRPGLGTSFPTDDGASPIPFCDTLATLRFGQSTERYRDTYPDMQLKLCLLTPRRPSATITGVSKMDIIHAHAHRILSVNPTHCLPPTLPLYTPPHCLPVSLTAMQPFRFRARCADAPAG